MLSVNEERDRQFSFQKMFNLVPLDCNVKRDDRQGCIMVSYECEELDQSGGAPVFPPPAGFGR